MGLPIAGEIFYFMLLANQDAKYPARIDCCRNAATWQFNGAFVGRQVRDCFEVGELPGQLLNCPSIFPGKLCLLRKPPIGTGLVHDLGSQIHAIAQVVHVTVLESARYGIQGS